MRRTVLAGVFLVSLSLISLEIVLTRIFAVLLWYHFAFLAVSLCLFGLGLGGIVLHFLRRLFSAENTFRDLSLLAFLQAVSTALALVVLLSVRLRSFAFDPGSLAGMLTVYLLAAAPFLFAGLFLSLVLSRYGKFAAKVYFIDLAGASVGCLLVIPALSILGAPAAVCLYGLTAAAAAALLARDIGHARLLRASFVAACVLGLFVIANPLLHVLEVRYAKGEEEPEKLAVQWNSFSRVIAYARPEIGDVMMEIDGIAHTPVNRFTGDPRAHWLDSYNIQYLPFHVLDRPKVLIFGSGGGEHIITALAGGSREVVGVEMNPIVVDMVRNRFADLSGGLFDLPNVRVVVDEGRSFIARSRESFDLIQFTLVDTWASDMAGAYVLTENNVFTREAFREYVSHLAPGGILSLKRWFEAREHTLRLMVMGRSVLEEMGVKDVSAHFFVAAWKDFSNLMMKREPFTVEEVSALLDACEADGMEVIYAPYYRTPENDFARAAAVRDIGPFIASYPMNIRPATDDRPFFFYTLRPSDLLRLNSLPYMSKVRNVGPLMLLGFGVVIAFAVVLFILAPLLLILLKEKPKSPGTLAGRAGYFALIGLGFLALEVALIQKFILFLGHPVYSLAVILFSILLFGGIGSYLSGFVPEDRLRSAVRIVTVFLVVYAGIFLFAAGDIFNRLIALSPGCRILISVALLVPAGLCMGIPFPAGVRLLAGKGSDHIPWMWGVNSSASVLGSVLAVLLALHAGFSWTIAFGLGCYLLSILLLGPEEIVRPTAPEAEALDRAGE